MADPLPQSGHASLMWLKKSVKRASWNRFPWLNSWFQAFNPHLQSKALYAVVWRTLPLDYRPVEMYSQKERITPLSGKSEERYYVKLGAEKITVWGCFFRRQQENEGDREQ